MKLRPYQQRSINDLYASMRSGNRRVILCGCTGYGKTIVGAEIIRRAIDKGSNVLWLADRKELIWQARDRFDEFGIGDHVGVIMAGEEYNLNRSVQIASVMTYHRRLQLNDLRWNEWFHKADLIFYDEAHGSLAKIRRNILNLYKDKYLIGLTATPGRADGAAFGDVYQDIIYGATIGELTELGFLVPARYFGSKLKPDLKGVPIVKGEWQAKASKKRVDKKELVGDILTNWLRIAGGRPSIIFAHGVKHSRHIQKTFQKHGVKIEHVDAHTSKDERQQILESLRNCDIDAVTNDSVYVEGVDVPAASCCVLAKPVRFPGRLIQMGGRVLRSYPGKEDAIIIDHACCFAHPNPHKFLDEPIEWSLEGKPPKYKKPKKRNEKPILECDVCKAQFRGKRCPSCGTEIKSYGKKIETIEQELKELRKPKEKRYTMQDKRRWWGMLEYYRRTKTRADGSRYSPGWTSHQYKKRFGVWPNGMEGSPLIEPDKEFRNYMAYRAIKWRKKQEKIGGATGELLRECGL